MGSLLKMSSYFDIKYDNKKKLEVNIINQLLLRDNHIFPKRLSMKE
jgi:hypothetical protein